MKAKDRFGPEYKIKCYGCGNDVDHDIDENLMMVVPCQECMNVAKAEMMEWIRDSTEHIPNVEPIDFSMVGYANDLMRKMP